jgi:hypothetical protein
MGSPESDLYRHLAAEAKADSKAAFLEQQAIDLLEGEYNPERVENLAEFLGNMPEQLVRELALAIKHDRADEVMAIINDGGHMYWKQSAREEVGRRLRRGDYDRVPS